MGRILDPDWTQFKYVPAAKTDLRVSMEKYKERVFAENQRICDEQKTSGDGGRNNGPIPSQPVYGIPGARLISFRKKG